MVLDRDELKKLLKEKGVKHSHDLYSLCTGQISGLLPDDGNLYTSTPGKRGDEKKTT